MHSKQISLDFRSPLKISFRACLVLIGAWLVSGCTTPQGGKLIANFAEATRTTTANIATAFQTVENHHFQAKVAVAVVTFDPNKGLEPKQFSPLFDGETISVRLETLKALSTYANKLSEIVSNNQLEEFDNSTKKFGESLIDLAKTPDFEEQLKRSKTLTTQDIGLFATAINALGRWYIETRREEIIRDQTKKMHETIKTICNLLQKDIGENRCKGLRALAWDAYGSHLMALDMWIRNNYKLLQPSDQFSIIQHFSEILRYRVLTDEALESTYMAIGQLSATHGKLEDAFGERTTSLAQAINSLILEARRVEDFYKDLTKK